MIRTKYDLYSHELGRFNAAARMHEACGRTAEGDAWLRVYQDNMNRALNAWRAEMDAENRPSTHDLDMIAKGERA